MNVLRTLSLLLRPRAQGRGKCGKPSPRTTRARRRGIRFPVSPSPAFGPPEEHENKGLTDNLGQQRSGIFRAGTHEDNDTISNEDGVERSSSFGWR
jgi:hypothetical protein